MSQTAVAIKNRDSIAASSDFLKFRSIVEAAADFLKPAAVLPMLDELLSERLHQEVERLAMQPEWLRHLLERRGEVLTFQLLKSNWDHVGNAAHVTRAFKIPRSTLHREKDAGKAITFRPTEDAEFVFPLEQFEPEGILQWPATVIQAVGNGAPALHFIYVPRKQLENQSFAEALRDPRGRDVVAMIRKTANRLTAE